MRIERIAVLFYAALIISACNSNSSINRENDSARMTDSGIMNNSDNSGRGFDTSVIDTSGIAQ